MNIKDLIVKYKFLILYAFFGVCTTIVNVVAYGLLERLIGLSILWSTIIAWFLAVVFAYLTNRKWVFKSNAHTSKEIIKEIYSFFACRIGTGILDCVIMKVFADILGMNDIIVKFVANVLVIVLNYVASKLVVFKEKKTVEE